MSDAKTVFSTPWFAIEELPPVGGEGDDALPYYTMRAEDGVLILPVTTDGRLVLLRQWRPARGAFSLELPAGGVDGAESPAEAAARELLEETGYAAPRLVPVGRGGLALNRDTMSMHMFAALDAEPVSDRYEGELVILDPAAFRAAWAAGECEQLTALSILLAVKWTLGVDLL